MKRPFISGELWRIDALTGATSEPITPLELQSSSTFLPSTWFLRQCSFSSVSPTLVTSALGFTAFSSLFFCVVTWSPFPLLIMAIGVPVIWALLRRKAQSKALLFERDYPTFLLSLASAVKTGLDPFAAISHTVDLLPKEGVLAQEIRSLMTQLEKGKSEEEAILSFGATVPHPDTSLFRIALLLARTEGSSVASALHRLSKVTRARQSFRRKTRGALAMQKMSGMGIVLCAVGILVFQASTNFLAFSNALSHPVGKMAFSVGGVLLALGIIGISRIGRDVQ